MTNKRKGVMSNVIKLPDCKCKPCMQNWLNRVLDAGLAPTEDDLLLLEGAKPTPDDDDRDSDNKSAVDDTASATGDSLPQVEADSELISYNDLGDQLFVAIDSRGENEGVLLFNFLLNYPLSMIDDKVYCGKELIALISGYERRILIEEGI